MIINRCLRIKCTIRGQYMRRSMSFTNKMDKKLTYYRYYYDIYMFERYVNHDINQHKFSELIVNKTDKHAINRILNIYKRLKRKGYYPSDISVEDMEYMMRLSNGELQTKHMRNAFINEFKSWYRNNRTTDKKLKCETDINCLFDDYGNLLYGFERNSLFANSYSNSLRKYSTHKLRNAAIFAQKIVIDCSFDEQMAEFEVTSAARQMARIYSANRLSLMPFDLHYCNCEPNSRVIKRFKQIIKCCDKPEYLVNCHQQSYIELFPNCRLVYLTPHSPNTLNHYDHNAVYILGSLVGKTCDLPLTLFKANYERIEHCKLPLHIYIDVKYLAKVVLSFQAVFHVLLEVNQHSNWALALTNNLVNNELNDCGIEEKRETVNIR